MLNYVPKTPWLKWQTLGNRPTAQIVGTIWIDIHRINVKRAGPSRKTLPANEPKDHVLTPRQRN